MKMLVPAAVAVVVAAALTVALAGFLQADSSPSDAGDLMADKVTGGGKTADAGDMMEGDKVTGGVMEDEMAGDGMAGGEMMESQPGLVSFADNYYRYEPAAYEQALSEGKVVFLDFYASWCPICNAERPSILAAFNELQSGVAGFQVHYNDNEAQESDRELAREFGVSYQHTKIILSGGEEVFRSLTSMSKESIISELEKARGA